MILGIAFLGEERRPLSSRIRVWSAHVAGGALGGVGAAFLVWVLLTPIRTMLPSRALVIAGASVMILAAWMQLTGKRFWRSGLVPSTWPNRYGQVVGWGLLGLVLGSGLGSYVVTTLIYCTYFLAGLTVSLLAAIGAGALLGIARTFTVGLASLMPARCGRWAYLSGRGPRLTGLVGTLVAACGGLALLARAL